MSGRITNRKHIVLDTALKKLFYVAGLGSRTVEFSSAKGETFSDEAKPYPDCRRNLRHSPHPVCLVGVITARQQIKQIKRELYEITNLLGHIHNLLHE